MKHFLKITLFICLMAFFLSAWSLPTGAASRITSANGQVARGYAGGKPSLANFSDPRGMGDFTAVAAVSASDIWAVGSGLGTLIEHWNGSQWSIVNSPNPGGSFNDLYGVAAVSANDAWAVGSYSDQGIDHPSKTLIEHWNGSQWSVIPSPSPGAWTNRLMGVTAVSANDVWAVGLTAPNGQILLTLIEHWNGTQWSVVTSPSPNNEAILNSVAVVSTSNAWSVGYFYGPGGQQTLIEHWNGSQWSVISSPNSVRGYSGGGSSDDLVGIAAVSANNVWSVGYFSSNGSSTQTLIEHWNGSQWSLVSSPSPGSSGNYLFGVATVSASDIWAVGDEQRGTSELTLIEHWNGVQWSVVASPNVGTGNNQLNSVATISSNQVWAVGHSINGPVQTLAEQWNGTTWSVVTSPDRIGNGNLSSVAAVSASDIWAVGSDVDGTLTEHWDGIRWSYVASPSPGLSNFLNGVAAVSTNNVWAVGQDQNSTGFQTLIEHWNGSQWSVIASPNSAAQFNNLASVAVVSANDIWAVGNSDVGSQTLIEHWNGSQWSVIPSPNPGLMNSLSGVAAVSTNNVWAVGVEVNSSGIHQPLIEQWNGTQWRVVKNPPSESSMSELRGGLTGVTAVSASDIWAVGTSTGTSSSQTLTEHYNGSYWSVVPSPNVGPYDSLSSVSAVSASDVWAVGSENGGTLTERWNGTKWSVVPSPNPGSIGNSLNAVVAISASDAWAVGIYFNNGYDTQSLVEHWDGSAWSMVTSPNVATHPTSGS